MKKNNELNQESKTLKATRVFLTIPHFDQLDEVYQKLELKSKELLIHHFAVVCETHTQSVTKGKHLHVFAKFIKQREISFKFFDFLGKHGKLEAVRSHEAVLLYMHKENACRANFDVWLDALQSTNFTRTISLMYSQGWNRDTILMKYVTQVTGSKPWDSAFKLAERTEIAKVEQELKSEIQRMRKITREVITARLSHDELALFDANPNFQKLIDVFNNVLKYGNLHPYKECCIALVGKPSIGKSTLVRALKKHFTTYIYPLDGWHTQYANGVSDIIIWNEWDIKLMSRSDLLLFTEGEVVDLRVKYTKAVKKDRPLIVLTSNDTWRNQVNRRYAYDHAQCETVLAALNTRIQEFDFGDTSIWWLTKLFVATTDDITL